VRRLIASGSPYEAAIGYSRAVVRGDWCFVSGCTGGDPVTRAVPEDVAVQARNALSTIAGVLAEAGFGMADVVRVQYTLTDRALVDAAAPVLAEAFASVRPAATMVFAGLIDPAMKIEIEVTAFRG
jgi:enamine deaminase RidA (YjgF/YER057c/UK114 family)